MEKTERKPRETTDGSEKPFLSESPGNADIQDSEAGGATNNRGVIVMMIFTGFSILLIPAEIGCIVTTSLSIQYLRTHDVSLGEDSSDGVQQKLPFVPCGKKDNSSCTVIDDTKFSMLIKVMMGVKRQSDIKLRRRKNFRGRLLRINCQYFTVSKYVDGLKWRGDYYNNYKESDGHVTISEDGTYGIYNLFTFSYTHGNLTTGAHRNQTDQAVANLVHRIHLNRSPKSEQNASKIIFEKNTLLNAVDQAFTSSELFEFLDLRQGDVLYPSLSDPSFIFAELEKSNFWGIFFVG